MKSIRQAWRMTLRDWRAGELRLLLAALLVAVAAVTSVGFFVDRIRLGLDRDAAQLLGGDLVVVGDLELPAQYRTEAERLGLSVAQTITFPSMAIREPQPGESGDPRSQLAGIKAVSPEYPLRGALKIAERSGGPEQSAQGIPPRGEAWVDEQLVSVLGVRVGEFLRLGDATLRVGRIITFEPDRTAGFINFAPRVLIRDDELPSTGLIQFGSRVTYRLMVAGERSSIRAYEAWLKPRLTRGQRAETLEAGRPEMQQAIERAKSFLALVALLTAMLAAVAIALAARRYSQRHIDACAVMRCLGSTQPFITRLFAIEFIVLALVGSVIGTLLG
ncbi:MAG TPA: FtsX-like permease family protein, partial [Burkholderiaceae bacterium]|nr:FtsX-like permease family protein [Burkholderiaceae bacterium]